jgi:D-3-phosphoglycerate dehydrogenase
VDGEHPLLKMPSALCTPHLGYVEKDNYEAYYAAVADAIDGYAAGKPVNVLNPEALTVRRSRAG